ncbi:MAG: hypothetical protein AAF721_16645 [Myxococcota bacterium]
MTKDTPDPDNGPIDEDAEVVSNADDDAVDLEKVLGGGSDDEEAALDLTDLDELGVDGVVERLRGGPEDPTQDADDLSEAGIGGRPRQARSPFISAIVLTVAGYLLVTMFADFRYWLRSGEAIDLGDASDLVASGRLDSGDLHDQYVLLRGTPDVQHAARLTTKSNYVGYLRITEGSGSLFAALPRSKEEKVYNTFEGSYQGRMTRLGTDRAFPWLEQFFGNEKLSQPIDRPTEAWLAALAAAGPGGALSVDGVEVAAGDQVRVVTDTPDVRVQLGRSSFSASSAEQALAGLGYPWIAQDPTATFYRFVARIPEAERAEALAALEKDAKNESENPADPAIGVVLLPLRAAYLAEAGMLRVSDSTLSFPYGDNTTSPGYDVKGAKLVERSLGEGGMKVAFDRISAVRYEQPIEVDPDGYIIEVGADPSSERMAGILWLVVLGLATVNLASILLWLRRRGT